MSNIPPKQRRWTTWGGLFVLLLVLVAGYYLWLANRVHHDLDAARDQAEKVKAALADGDADAASKALEQFADASESARSHTNSLPWKAIGWVPVIGANTKAATTVSDVAVDIAADVVRPAVDETRGGVMKKLVPHDGRIDLAAVRKLQPTLQRIDAALDRAGDRIDGIGADHLLSFVEKPLADLRDQVGTARTGADAADRAAKLMPAMLGGDGPRRYLLMFDNNAEVRATGGVPGAWAIVRAAHGKMSLVQQGSAAEFGELRKPVLPQPVAEHKLYDRQIATYFQDVNFTPEFPRTAALARAMYEQKFHQPLDGVMSMDAVTLGYLLRATGPVEVDGVTLTSDNAADELLNKAYTRIRDPKKQDVFFAEVANAVFDKVSSGVESPTKLASALAKAADEGRLYLNSGRPEEQAELTGTEIAGDLDVSAGTHPRIGVYLNDATGAKMSYFLRSSTHVHSDRCDEGQQALSGYVDLHMVKPTPDQLTPYVTGGGKYGIPAGQQMVVLHIYGPVGATMSDFRVDGDKSDPDIVVDRGRPVATAVVQIKGDQTIRVRWSTLTTSAQSGSVEVTTTPGLDSAPARTTVASSCS